MTAIKRLLAPATRTYLYKLGVAVVAILTAYGVIDGYLIEHWELLLLSTFGLTGNGLATAYRPTLTASERDDATALRTSAAAVVDLHRAQAPDRQISEAVDVLDARLR